MRAAIAGTAVAAVVAGWFAVAQPAEAPPTQPAPRAVTAQTLTPVKVLSKTTANTVATYKWKNSLLLDATYMPGVSNRPWVLLIHGGYWQQGGKPEMNKIAQTLESKGFQAFSIDYYLKALWPQQRYDTLGAYQWIQDNAATFGLDPKRGAILGFSAGGQMALTAATYGEGATLTNGVVALAPSDDPYRAWRYAFSSGTPEELKAHPSTYGLRKLAGSAFALTNWCYPDPNVVSCWNQWRSITPANSVTAGDAPIYVVHPSGDGTVPDNSSDGLKARYDEVGVPATLRYSPNSAHSISIFDDYVNGIVNFLTGVTS